MSLLSVEHVAISFGGVRALADVSLDLNRGEILGLIGPNGAGKTTLFNCISGVLTPDKGKIRFEDRSINSLRAHTRAQRGIARTFQNLQLWGSMTVLENCKMPIDALNSRSIIMDALRLPWSTNAEHSADEHARAVLHSLSLLEHADTRAADLPVGLQRRVEIARALCMRPQLILLDEPASGLDAGETEDLAKVLTRVRDRFRVSMLLVDHDMSLVMRACDYIYVLDFGEMIAQGRPDQVREDSRVIEAYLGEAPADDAPLPETAVTGGVHSRQSEGDDGEAPEPEALLEVTGLHAGYGGIEVIRDVNLRVGRGEVVACIGANGAGKTTTLRAISGVIKPTSGTVILEGEDIARRTPEAIVKRGIIHVPQGRGLFPKLTVAETLELAHYSGAKSDDLSAAFDAFPILKDRQAQLVGTLSGGQQQMVAMARAMLVKPKLLLVDEMSQGLAPAVVQQLFERISIFKQQGIAVFLVEQFVDSALAVADRAYVFEQGTIGHEAPARILRSNQDVIASSYLGTAASLDPTSLGAASNGSKRRGREMLSDLSIKLPAELKRSLEERAAHEGRDTDTLVLELLASREQKETRG